MLYEVMKYTRNFFPGKNYGGTIEISNGEVNLPIVGLYALIEGSRFNDGVHKLPLTGLTDETFEGYITEINPPKEFLELVEKIEAYDQANPKPSWDSESFGGYSRSGYIGWKESFRDSLKVWCKI